MRTTRALAALATLAVLGTTVPAPASPQTGRRGGDTLPVTILDLIGDTLGADAAVATLRARDRGYDANQTLGAVSEGQLAVDGAITEDSGPVTPAGQPEEVLSEAGESEVVDALTKTRRELARVDGVDPPRKFRELLDVVVLLQLMSDGYTLEQIVFDGIIAGGIDLTVFGQVAIVEEVVNGKGKRVTRFVEPGEPELDDPVVAGVIRDMVTIVEGHDPLDPDFKPKFQVTLRGRITIEGNDATIEARGRLGTTDGGDCCLGRVRGTITVPPGPECPGEVAPLAISFNGFTADDSGAVALGHSWEVTGAAKSTGGGGGDGGLGCISINDAPELIELVASVVGPFRGFVAVGETLTDDAGGLKLRVKKKV